MKEAISGMVHAAATVIAKATLKQLQQLLTQNHRHSSAVARLTFKAIPNSSRPTTSSVPWLHKSREAADIGSPFYRLYLDLPIFLNAAHFHLRA